MFYGQLVSQVFVQDTTSALYLAHSVGQESSQAQLSRNFTPQLAEQSDPDLNLLAEALSQSQKAEFPAAAAVKTTFVPGHVSAVTSMHKPVSLLKVFPVPHFLQFLSVVTWKLASQLAAHSSVSSFTKLVSQEHSVSSQLVELYLYQACLSVLHSSFVIPVVHLIMKSQGSQNHVCDLKYFLSQQVAEHVPSFMTAGKAVLQEHSKVVACLSWFSVHAALHINFQLS